DAVRRQLEMGMRQQGGAPRPCFHAESRQYGARIELEAAPYGFSGRFPSLEASPRRAARRPGARLRQDGGRFAADQDRLKGLEVDPDAHKHGFAAETLLQLIADPDTFRDRPETQ